MKLNKFITNILNEVSIGVKNANIDGRPFTIEGYRRDNERGFINFDIGVRTVEGSASGSKAGIEVVNIGFGGKIEKSTTSENTNRIKFSVLINHDIK